MNLNTKNIFEKTSLIILLGSLTAFDPISIDMYLSAFPIIAKDFSVGISTVEISLSAFFIGLALGQLIYGPLVDIYGRKKPLIIGMFIYFLASLGCAVSSNITIFIIFRVLQALGGCAGMVITRAIVSDVFDKKKAAHVYSLLMLIMGVSPILAPLIGSYLTTYLGWRSIFATLASLSLICLFYTIHLLPETGKIKKQEIAAKSFFSILPDSFRNYFDLLKDRSFLSYALSGGLSRAAMFAYIAGSPFVFISYFHISPEKYGWIFGANALGIISASQINRYLLKHFQIEKVYKRVALSAVFLAGILLFNSLFFKSIYFILIPLFALITSIGFIMPNSAALSLSNQGHRAGIASALLGTIQWSVAFLSSFLVSHFHNNTPIPMTSIIFGCSCLSFLSLHVAGIHLENKHLSLEPIK